MMKTITEFDGFYLRNALIKKKEIEKQVREEQKTSQTTTQAAAQEVSQEVSQDAPQPTSPEAIQSEPARVQPSQKPKPVIVPVSPEMREKIIKLLGEALKVEGDRLKALQLALLLLQKRSDRIKRVVVLTRAQDGEKIPQDLTEQEGFYFKTEYYPEPLHAKKGRAFKGKEGKGRFDQKRNKKRSLDRKKSNPHAPKFKDIPIVRVGEPSSASERPPKKQFKPWRKGPPRPRPQADRSEKKIETPQTTSNQSTESSSSG